VPDRSSISQQVINVAFFPFGPVMPLMTRGLTALKFPGFCDLVSGFLRLVTVWLHVGRGGVTGSDGP
jgi:hypothetical protein